MVFKKVCIQVRCVFRWVAPTLVGGPYWPANEVGVARLVGEDLLVMRTGPTTCRTRASARIGRVQ
jgi:hypothetical protein